MVTSRLLMGAVAAVGLGIGVTSLAATSHGRQSAAIQTAGQRSAGNQGGGTVSLISPGPSAARFPRNAEEFDQMFNQVKNWGRWGPDDQLGAANLITAAKRKQALALAKLGIAGGL